MIILLMQEFLREVFNQNCPCFDTTCQINFSEADAKVRNLVEIFRKFRNSKVCATFFDKKKRENNKILNKHLETFLDLSLIYRHGNSFYMHNGEKLTWSNIKAEHQENKNNCFCKPIATLTEQLVKMFHIIHTSSTPQHENACNTCSKMNNMTENDAHRFTQALFWYFRKSIVDNLIQYVSTASSEHFALEKGAYGGIPPSCRAMSVGSTNLSSDYDITLYGSCVTHVLRTFHSEFQRVFGDTSATVFDTNVYGSSFIDIPGDLLDMTFVTKSFYDPVNCAKFPEYDDETFFFIKEMNGSVGKVAAVQQHVFALVKLFRACSEILTTGVYATSLKKLVSIIREILLSLQFLSHLQKFLSVTFDVDTYSPVSARDRDKDLEDTDDEYLWNNVKDAIQRKIEQVWKNGETLYRIHQGLFNMYTYSDDSHAETGTKRIPSFDDDYDSDSSDTSSISYSGSSGSTRSSRSSSPYSEYLTLFTKKDDGSHKARSAPEYSQFSFDIVSNSKSYTELLNTISILNFYGAETYLTRGAFLHVVFLMQTCKDTKQQIVLGREALLDSFTENFADFLTHGKMKYVNRMYRAVTLMEDYKYPLSSTKGQVKKILGKLHPFTAEKKIQEKDLVLVTTYGFKFITENVIIPILVPNLADMMSDMYGRASFLKSSSM
jgi:hypothetical protein